MKKLFLTMLLACTGSAIKSDLATELTDKVSSLHKQHNELLETKNLPKSDLTQRLQTLHQQVRYTLETLPAKSNPKKRAIKALAATALYIVSIQMLKNAGHRIDNFNINRGRQPMNNTTDPRPNNTLIYHEIDSWTEEKSTTFAIGASFGIAVHQATSSMTDAQRNVCIDGTMAVGSSVCMIASAITALYQTTRCIIDCISLRTSTIEIQRADLEKLISDLENDLVKLNA